MSDEHNPSKAKQNHQEQSEDLQPQTETSSKSNSPSSIESEGTRTPNPDVQTELKYDQTTEGQQNFDSLETPQRFPTSKSSMSSIGKESSKTSGSADAVASPRQITLTSQVEQQTITTATQEVDQGSSQPKWRSFASFKLEFQARDAASIREDRVLVQNLESKQTKDWLNLNDAEIYDWILDQVAEITTASSQLQPSSLQPTLEISEVHFLQHVALPNKNPGHVELLVSNNTLRGDNPVVLEVVFKLAGAGISNLTRRALHFQIKGKYHNRMTGQNIPLTPSFVGNLVPDQRVYSVRLPQTELSPGLYQLQVVTTLEHSPLTPAIFEVPILQVS